MGSVLRNAVITAIHPDRVRRWLFFLIESSIAASLIVKFIDVSVSFYVMLGIIAVVSVLLAELGIISFLVTGALFYFWISDVWLTGFAFGAVVLLYVLRSWESIKQGSTNIPVYLLFFVAIGGLLGEVTQTIIVAGWILLLHQINELRLVQPSVSVWAKTLGVFLAIASVVAGAVVAAGHALALLRPAAEWVLYKVIQLGFYFVNWLLSPFKEGIADNWGKLEPPAMEQPPEGELPEPAATNGWIAEMLNVLVYTVGALVLILVILWIIKRLIRRERVELTMYPNTEQTDWAKKGKGISLGRKGRKKGPAVPDDPVRRLYYRLLKVVKEAGVPRSPHHTVREWVQLVVTQHHEVKGAINTLSEAYEDRRYGDHEVTSEELAKLKARMEEVVQYVNRKEKQD